jgi:hypothetical protein
LHLEERSLRPDSTFGVPVAVARGCSFPAPTRSGSHHRPVAPIEWDLSLRSVSGRLGWSTRAGTQRIGMVWSRAAALLTQIDGVAEAATARGAVATRVGSSDVWLGPSRGTRSRSCARAALRGGFSRIGLFDAAGEPLQGDRPIRGRCARPRSAFASSRFLLRRRSHRGREGHASMVNPIGRNERW